MDTPITRVEMSSALPGEISRCLSLFKNSSTDNEKLASLMLIAKISKSSEISTDARKRIYSGIGFDFVNRLLTTEAKDEFLHHVAVAILTCYCTDPQLVLHPQVTSKIISFNRFISSPSSAHVLVQDCLQCLTCIMQTRKGVEYLWKYKSISALFECYATHKDNQEMTSFVLSQLLSHKDVASVYHDQLLSSVNQLSLQFKDMHSDEKFDVCCLLKDIINSDLPQIAVSDQWLSNIRLGLSDILRSKLDARRRVDALLLSGTLCQQYGANWTLSANDRSFVLLLVHLASIEVQLSLKDYYAQPPMIVIASFSILESVIVLMANEETEHIKQISEETLLQLHTTLMECLSFLVKTLKTHEEERKTFPSSTPPPIEHIVPSVRLLGAWLAEDSLSLSDGIYSLLPYLLCLCESVENDVLKFLLPGFSNLVTDSMPRRLLLENGLLSVLLEHVRYHMRRVPFCKEAQTQVLSCYSLLLTLLLSDQPVCSTVEFNCPEWLVELSTVIQDKSESNSNMQLWIHSCLLILIIGRRNDAVAIAGDDVITDIVKTLSSPLLLRDTQSWLSVSELWHISMQELQHLVTISPEARRKVSSYMGLFDTFIQDTKGVTSNKHVHVDMLASITTLQQALPKRNEP